MRNFVCNAIFYFLLLIQMELSYMKAPKKRIIHGVRAKYGQFPGIVSIQRRSGGHYCGGTLVNLLTVISAAHCFESLDSSAAKWSQVKVVGNHLVARLRTAKMHQHQIRFARFVIIHPNYTKNTVKNDIAILKLFRKFDSTEYFHPIRIAADEVVPGTLCNVSGWGDTSGRDDLVLSDDLLYVNVHILDDIYCSGPNYQSFDASKQYCAGHIEGGKDACSGDSGGPLTCNGVLAGVVSYGIGCALPGYPGVYTIVSSYRDWIEKAIAWDGKTPFTKVLIEYKNCAKHEKHLNYILKNLINLLITFRAIGEIF